VKVVGTRNVGANVTEVRIIHGPARIPDEDR
jgi:hypothetical protein